MPARKKEALHEDAVFDGRTRRLMCSLTDSAEEAEKTMNAISFDEDLQTGGDKRKRMS